MISRHREELFCGDVAISFIDCHVALCAPRNDNTYFLLLTSIFMQEELKFPLMCHFRIVTRDLPNMALVIQTVLGTLGIDSPVQPENRSTQGSYVSFSVDVRVESKEMLTRIDEELRAIEGVKMVL